MLTALLVTTAFAFDFTAYQAVLDTHVNDGGRVNYAAVKEAGALDATLTALQDAAEPTDRSEKIAFWLNAYNALTIDLIADNFPLASIRDLDGGNPWDTRRFKVAGRMVTLNDIENRILRPMGDPRVHAALNCASIGCPPLSKRAFDGKNLDRQLVAASKRWVEVNGVKVDAANKSVKLSSIFDWYGDDFKGMNDTDIPGFDGKQEGALNFVARYLPEDQAAFLRRGGFALSYSDYNWDVNKQ